MLPGRDKDLTGQTLQEYSLIRFIDQGGMADVYLAAQVRLRRNEVLKVLASKYASIPEFVERFQREAQSMSHMDHPNIVRIYATGDTPDNRPYFAMQYAPKGTVAKKMDQVHAQGAFFSTAYALAIMRQVASALNVVHGKGFVHRDVKPSNILLLTDSRPLLADMGIAFSHNNPRLTRENILLGTPDYMSPEQAASVNVDGRSDIFSVGTILYEMLSNVRPFAAENDWTVIHGVINNQPVPLRELRPDLNKEVLSVVSCCMQKDPARRYQNAEQLMAALDGALVAEGESVGVTPDGEWVWEPSTGRFVRSGEDVQQAIGGARAARRLRRAVVAGLLIILALFAAFALFNAPTQATSVSGGETAVIASETPEVAGGVEETPSQSTEAPPPTSTLASEGVAGAIATTATVPVTATEMVTPSPTAPQTTVTAEVTEEAVDAIRLRTTSPVFYYGGPGTEYPHLGDLGEGVLVAAIGRSPGDNWLLASLENGSEVWLPAAFVEIVGGVTLDEIAEVATVPAPPAESETPETETVGVPASVSIISPTCGDPGKYRANGEALFEWRMDGGPGETGQVGVVVGGKVLSGAADLGGGAWMLRAPVADFYDGSNSYNWQVWLLDQAGGMVSPLSSSSCLGMEGGGSGAVDGYPGPATPEPPPRPDR